MITSLVFPLLLSFGVLLVIIYLSHKHDLFMDNAYHDKPQNFHHHSTPRSGSIGILAGLAFFAFSTLGLKFIIPVILAFLSGIFEDFHNSLSPKLRLLLQLIAAVGAIWFTDSVVTYLGLGITMPYSVGLVFSAFAIVGMMNAINIIDGFNGLASGVILLMLLSFGITAYQQENTEILYLILVTAGATLGFFLLNFPKGKIFLGDGGAYMLGFVIAIIGIYLASKYELVSPWYIFSVFIYPVWEVLFSIMRKRYIGLSPMQPDSYHFHMLVYRQITQNNPLTALFITVMILPFMTLSTLYSHNSMINILVAGGFILCYLFLYAYLYKKDTVTVV